MLAMPRKQYRRKKRSVRRFRRKLSRRGINMSGLTFTKLSLTTTITNSAANIISYPFTMSNVSNAQDWSQYGNLYDSYRVYGLKIKWIPTINISPETPVVTNPLYGPMFVAYDLDESAITPLDTVNEIIQYQNHKIKNLYRPWTYYAKRTKQSAPFTTTGGSTGMLTSDGFADIDNTDAFAGVIGIRCDNNIAATNTIIGMMISTYYVGFKNRR